MGVEKGQGALAGLGGGSGVVIGALVAIETMSRVVVEEDRKIRKGVLDFLNVGGGDMFILRTEMQHGGAAGLFS